MAVVVDPVDVAVDDLRDRPFAIGDRIEVVGFTAHNDATWAVYRTDDGRVREIPINCIRLQPATDPVDVFGNPVP